MITTKIKFEDVMPWLISTVVIKMSQYQRWNLNMKLINIWIVKLGGD